jgi:membrane protein DedA with SNARE-associated domain
VIQWLSFLSGLPIGLLTAALGVTMVLDSIPLLGILVPADIAVLTAITTRDAVSSLAIVAAVVGGCVAGWSISFLVGRRLGDRVRRSRFGRWIGASRWEAAERLLAGEGRRMLLAAPFLPVFNTLVPLVAGGLRMPYRRFVTAVAAGSALWAGLYVSLGLLAAELGSLLPDSFASVATVVVGFVLSWVSMLGARRTLAARGYAAPAGSEVAGSEAGGSKVIGSALVGSGLGGSVLGGSVLRADPAGPVPCLAYAAA